MKNFYYRSILIIFLCLVFSWNAVTFAHDKASIEDELLKSNYIKSHANEYVEKTQSPISDELLNFDLYTNSPFKLSVYVNKYANQPIEDELLADGNFVANAGNYVISKKNIPDDYFFEKSIDITKARKIKHKNKYDFTKKEVPIQIRIAEHLKSTKNVLEGSTIPFVAQHDFEINGEKYEQGTTILGRIESISASDKMGTPESIKISNFYIPDEKKEIELHGTISKNGANRSIWVYPLYQAGNITLYVAGFVFVPIHGGRAKLLTSETFTVYFESQ